jgi:hypothetical protein
MRFLDKKNGSKKTHWTSPSPSRSARKYLEKCVWITSLRADKMWN